MTSILLKSSLSFNGSTFNVEQNLRLGIQRQKINKYKPPGGKLESLSNWLCGCGFMDPILNEIK